MSQQLKILFHGRKIYFLPLTAFPEQVEERIMCLICEYIQLLKSGNPQTTNYFPLLSLVHISAIGFPVELFPECFHLSSETSPSKVRLAPTRELSLEKNSIFSVYFPFSNV